MEKIKVTINGETAEVSKGLSILKSSWEMVKRLPSSCGGNAICTKCAVEVIKGVEHLSGYTEDEENLRKRYQITEPQIRLGCQAKVFGEIEARSIKL